MVDPVIAADNCSYERKEILRWLKTNNTSPITSQKLANRDVKPNLELKAKINEWLESKNKPQEQILPEDDFQKKDEDAPPVGIVVDKNPGNADADEDYIVVEEDD